MFTGGFEKMSRSEAKAIAEENGAKILGSISKKLNYLVIGNSKPTKKKIWPGTFKIELPMSRYPWGLNLDVLGYLGAQFMTQNRFRHFQSHFFNVFLT